MCPGGSRNAADTGHTTFALLTSVYVLCIIDSTRAVARITSHDFPLTLFRFYARG